VVLSYVEEVHRGRSVALVLLVRFPILLAEEWEASLHREWLEAVELALRRPVSLEGSLEGFHRLEPALRYLLRAVDDAACDPSKDLDQRFHEWISRLQYASVNQWTFERRELGS
jgi:thioesterase domain-containing protein